MIVLLFAFLLLMGTAHAESPSLMRADVHAQSPRASDAANEQAQVQKIKKLYDSRQWDAVVRAVAAVPQPPTADLELYRGLALAQLGHLRRAERSFRAGHLRFPHDPRFLEEMAGIAYRQKHFARAAADLRGALKLDSKDSYANDFLGSIYYLEGNLEAALKYWNRVDKPRLTDLTYEPVPHLTPLILDRAFRFSPGAVWTQDRFLTTQAQVAALQEFPNTFYDLQSATDGTYQLIFHGGPPGGWTGMNVPSVLSTLRWLPYQAVVPDFYNVNHKGLNWLSFVRWDAQKRMITTEIAMLIEANPSKRLRLYFDGRNENWDITHTLLPSSPSPSGLNFERAVLGAGVQGIPSWRWQWSLDAEYSYRDFRSLVGIPAQADRFFTRTSGVALQYQLQRPLIRFPERRFTLDGSATGEAGRFFSSPLGRYGRAVVSLLANWFPQATGEDYSTHAQIRAGKTFGQVPFDDLFMLGFDRDNPLWLRGHYGLIHGKKGNAPLGRNFILSNTDVDKIVYRDGIFLLKLGPFVDSGDIYDPSAFFGSREWLTDTGVQATVRVLGRFEVVFGYGKALQSGANAFYSTISK